MSTLYTASSSQVSSLSIPSRRSLLSLSLSACSSTCPPHTLFSTEPHLSIQHSLVCSWASSCRLVLLVSGSHALRSTVPLPSLLVSVLVSLTRSCSNTLSLCLCGGWFVLVSVVP